MHKMHIIRPHRSTTYVDAAYCYRLSSVVCQSLVCLSVLGLSVTPVSPAKTAEPIKMLCGLWARMGTRNHVLHGSPEVLSDVAMATNFGTQFAITGSMALMDYNFGCMIASDTLFDSREVGFWGQAIRRKCSRDWMLKAGGHGNQFWD